MPTNATAELAKIRSELKSQRVNVTGSGRQRFASDAVDAMVYRAGNNPSMPLSTRAASLASRPLWAIAVECLQQAGVQGVDQYSSREQIAEQAMAMGTPLARTHFFSENEDHRYISASSPAARPGDFPAILSAMANKFIDTIELDDEYSYEHVSALTPEALQDFKPTLMTSLGTVDELDELQDTEQFRDLTLGEEALSYIYLRRFGNKFGWTPVMIANDDMGAFAEGMIGLREAWEVTQNRLVIDRFTSNENLLDGYPLFADRPDVGSAANKNIRVNGTNKPTDAEWGAMNEAYAEIAGIGTSRRVRGELNVAFTPTGTYSQDARRVFMTLGANGIENKIAADTSNVGIYRDQVGVVPESELRQISNSTWYGLRSPTKFRTATVVRGYFSGFGTKGRRETWFDPTNKTTYVSLEGRIGVAVKNWRYAIKNSVS